VRRPKKGQAMSNRKLGTFEGKVTRIPRTREKGRFWLPFDARARARRGALLLDRVHGPGWAEKITLWKLNIVGERVKYGWGRCVLEQVYGGYGIGLGLLGLNFYQESRAHGFSPYNPISSNAGYLENFALILAYRAEVKSRLT
jgi:hypothetical protein